MIDAAANDGDIPALRGQLHALLERLQRNDEEFRRLSRAMWRVQEDERRRIARELHDGVGQNLTAMKHLLAQIGSHCGSDEAQRARVDSALMMCSRTLEETRELSRLLRPQILDELGLVPALQWLARTLGEASGLQIDVVCTLDAELDTDLTSALFRIAQEGLGNVVRHARAKHALLRLVRRGDTLHLLVWDDGRGFNPAAAWAAGRAGRSVGLASMHDRVRIFGGELQLDSDPERGSRLRATFPLRRA